MALIAEIVAGTLLVAGLATVWWMVSRRATRVVDPQVEIDRRIDDLENSLSRLQDVFGHAIRS